MHRRGCRRLAIRLAVLLAVSACLVAGQCPVAAADDAPLPLTLQECVARTVAGNHQAFIAASRREQAARELAAVRADRLPRLSADYSWTRLDDEQTTDVLGYDVILARKDNYAAHLRLRQPVFTGFYLRSAARLAELGLDQGRVGEELARLDLTYRAHAGYFAVLEAERLLAVADDAEASLTAHCRDARRFHEEGLIPYHDLLQAQVEEAAAAADARAARRELTIARSRLALLMGEPRERVYRPVEVPLADSVALDLDGLIAAALAGRPELQAANYRLEAARELVRQARSAWYPQVHLEAVHERIGAHPDVAGDDIRNPYQTSISLLASWELWDWQARSNRERRATAAVEEARRRLLQTEDEIRLAVQEHLLAYRDARADIETARIAERRGCEQVRIVEARYREQMSTTTEVLDARALLTATRARRCRARYACHLARAGLARALGRPDFGPVTTGGTEDE
ncbi:MAG: TolC family protein [Deltaproteobacteria bacterium]|nr:TolC family protein [Candidatus Anaeroferrophillacea bacterium]